MAAPTREDHRRYLAYLERFGYFARGGLRRLTLEEFLEAERRVEEGEATGAEAAELRRLLLRD